MAQQLSSSQLRAARGLLNWSRPDLATRTGVSEQTIHRFENNMGAPEARTKNKIQSVFEKMGIEFLPNDGIARRRDDVMVLRGTDADAMYHFYDDVYATVKDEGGVICVSGVDERIFDKYSRKGHPHSARMIAIKNKINMRVILQEGDYHLSYSGCFSYRWMPANQFASIPFYLYGRKLAIIKDSEDGFEVFMINSSAIADAFRKQFDFIWERCKIIQRKKA